MHQQQDKIETNEGFSTIINELDIAANGLCPGDLILVAGRPGTGKTELLMHLILHATSTENTPVLIFSIELSAENLLERLHIASNGEDSHLSDDKLPKLSRAIVSPSDLPLVIDDTPEANISRIRDKARCFVTEKQSCIIAVDYLQLINGSNDTIPRDKMLGEITRELKAMAVELNVPVILLSQVKRSVTSRKDQKPQVSDLPSPVVVESCTDIILFTYRKVIEDKELGTRKNVFYFDIAQIRRGPLTGAI